MTAEAASFSTYPVTLDELETMLRNHKAVNRIFRGGQGDSLVQYEKVVEVLDLLGRLGFPSGLVTQAGQVGGGLP